MKGYCLVCKRDMEILRPVVVNKNNRKLMKGVCSKNHKMSKFI